MGWDGALVALRRSSLPPADDSRLTAATARRGEKKSREGIQFLGSHRSARGGKRQMAGDKKQMRARRVGDAWVAQGRPAQLESDASSPRQTVGVATPRRPPSGESGSLLETSCFRTQSEKFQMWQCFQLKSTKLLRFLSLQVSVVNYLLKEYKNYFF